MSTDPQPKGKTRGTDADAGSFDPAPYAEGLRRANEAEAVAIRERAGVALAEAIRLAEAIAAADSRVRRIILFGSLARGLPARLDFDIDLAMEEGDLYAALDIVEASDFEVDLVELERMPPLSRERIEKEGRFLFARQGDRGF